MLSYDLCTLNGEVSADGCNFQVTFLILIPNHSVYFIFLSAWALWLHTSLLLIPFPQLPQTWLTLYAALAWLCCSLKARETAVFHRPSPPPPAWHNVHWQMPSWAHVAPVAVTLLPASQPHSAAQGKKNPLFDLLGASAGCRRACSRQEAVGILWITLGSLLCPVCRHGLGQAAAPLLCPAAALAARAACKPPTLKSSFLTLH